jgi:hypothetical protein
VRPKKRSRPSRLATAFTSPPEVRRYFAEVNGFAQGRGEMDAELVSLWPLSEVRLLSDEAPESTVPEPERYFVFGDWSLWCSRCT